MTPDDAAVLDDPVGESLRGRHAHLARRLGRTATYLPAVATFAAVPGQPTAADWADIARLLGPGALADLFSAPVTPPADWEPVFALDGVQMVAGPALAGVGPERADVVELGEADVPEVLELVALTRPGPFWARTLELGSYLGLREEGVLVAMAGERLRPPGWTEISAVCTAPRARGRGHASARVRILARRIVERGERPFLHVAADNGGEDRALHAAGLRGPPSRAVLRPPDARRRGVTGRRPLRGGGGLLSGGGVSAAPRRRRPAAPAR